MKFNILALFVLITVTSYPIIFCESLHDYCNKYGAKSASNSFKKQIYEYLNYFGIKNPQQVPIKKFDKNSKNLVGLWTPARCVTNIGIWLDESILNNVTPSKQIFILAHESAHWVQSLLTQIAPSKYREKDADIKAATMLCQHGYSKVVKNYIDTLKIEIHQGIGIHDDGQHPLKEQQAVYIQKIYDTYKTTTTINFN